MIVHQNDYVKITFDQNKKRLTQKWNDFATSNIFREAIDKTTDFVKENDVKTILSDTLNQKVVKSEDADYAAGVIPILVENGMKAMAFVVPENVFTQLSLNKFSSSVKGDTTGYFKSIAEAENWLDEKA